MFRRSPNLLILLLVAALPWAVRAAELADTPCYECHDELQEKFSKGSPHSPVEEGDCEACHEDHGDEESLKLSDEVPGLCFGCHDEFEKSHLHDPVGDGDCLGCHDPHHSSQPSLLNDTVPALCFDCHDEFDKAYQHDPVSEGDCLGCHTPHDSAQASLLRDAVPTLCYECHDNYGEGLSVHEPVGGGSCAEGHDPHQSEREVLLTARYDRKLRVVFSEDAYELCLGCHDLEAFTDPVTEDATEFRFGARNLHYVHLIGEEQEQAKKAYGIKKKRRKPRTSCSGCHLSHSAGQAKLIRPERERGEVTVFTISYREIEGGGGCVVGCHKPLQYVRDAARGGARPSQLTAPKQSKAPDL